MAEQRHETELIYPESREITLSSGTRCAVMPLKTRQFFKLMRIITRGGAGMMPQLAVLAQSGDLEDFLNGLVAVITFAIPEAEDQTIEFLQSIVEPVTTDLQGDESSIQRAKDRLKAELDDPEMEDTLSIIEKLVQHEAEDIMALGKRLRAMFQMAQKTGQTTPSRETGASAVTPSPSTSSPASTDGATTPSSTSPSDDSTRSPQPSPSG